MAKKRATTIEELARLMKRGFRDAARKQDLENLARTNKQDLENLARTSKQDLGNLAIMTKHGFDEITGKMATKDQLQLVVDNVDLLRADIHDIKITLGPLVSHTVAMEREVQDLKKRVDRVERKVGLA